jgi:hypothetical protein
VGEAESPIAVVSNAVYVVADEETIMKIFPYRFLFPFLLTTSCGISFYLEPDYNREKQPSAPSNSQDAKQDDRLQDPEQRTGLVTYNSDIKKLMTTSCTTCHQQGGQLPDLSSYVAVANTASVSLEVIEDGSMPPGKALSILDQNLFKDWIDEGSPKDDIEPNTSKPEGPGLSFVEDIKPILSKSCAISGCHDKKSATSGYEYQTFEGAAIGIDVGLATIKAKEMPPSGFPEVSRKNIKTLEDWLDAGAPK